MHMYMHKNVFMFTNYQLWNSMYWFTDNRYEEWKMILTKTFFFTTNRNGWMETNNCNDEDERMRWELHCQPISKQVPNGGSERSVTEDANETVQRVSVSRVFPFPLSHLLLLLVLKLRFSVRTLSSSRPSGIRLHTPHIPRFPSLLTLCGKFSGRLRFVLPYCLSI